MTCQADASLLMVTLLIFIAWLPIFPAARRLDRRIGVLVPNGAAANSQSPTTTSSATKPGAGSADYRSGLRLNSDELVKLGVDADEVKRHVRRLEEDDTHNKPAQQQQPARPRQQTAWSSSPSFQQMYRGKNPEQINAEYHLMRRYFIRNNRTAACNDGSRAGYV